MADLNIRNVEKAYGAVKVIHGVSLDIEDGQFVVLVGPSGCGKSTLLRMVAGLEEITGGNVAIGGKVVNDFHPKDRDIAMVFQNYALYPHMSVRENMGFSLRLNGIGVAERNRKIEGAAKILDLEPLLDRYPKELSGGQRQRVAMGRAIVRDPKVFLFDEPLSNLDAKLRVQMRTEIKSLHNRLRTTTVYVTHDQIEAMTMGDVIVVMHDGIVEQIGKPLELYDTPNNLFVAGFIGSPAMNFISGTLRPDGRSVFVTNGGTELPLPPQTSDQNCLPAIYGIRPEHIRVAPESPIKMISGVIEPTGSEIHINGTFDGQEFIGLFRERIHPAPGEEVGIEPEAKHAHVFDAKTGIRLVQ